ncbi:MAG: hypothetical protein HQ592_17215, partial [Planctomycetes bacterium]|nr:hypothetical protein [Planctomycetota bacterium]
EQWAGAPRKAEMEARQGDWSERFGEPTEEGLEDQRGGGMDFYLSRAQWGRANVDFAPLDSIADEAFDMNGKSYAAESMFEADALPEPRFFQRSSELMAFNAPMSEVAESAARSGFASRTPQRPGEAWGPAASMERRRDYGRKAKASKRQMLKGSGRSGRLNRGGALYPQMHIPREQPEPKVPEADPDVRKAIEALAQGPVDFHVIRKITHYDTEGQISGESEEERVLAGKKFVRENRRGGEITTRSLSDGERYYRCYEKKNYAAARKLLPQDYRNLRRDVPGMSGYTADEFLVTYSTGKIDSREGDTTVLVVEHGNNRPRFFIDTARKVLTRMENHYRQNKQSEFKLSSSCVYDNHKAVGGRLLPMRNRSYNADGKLTSERIIEKLQVGEMAGDFTFTPPKGTLIATYPLPSVADATKAAEDAKDLGQANFALAMALEQAREYKQAVAAVDKVIEHRPNDVHLLLYRDWLQTAMGKPDALDKAAEQAKKIMGPNRGPLVSVEAPERARKRRYELYRTLNDLLSRAGLDRVRCIETLLELSEKGGSDRINWACQLAGLHANRGAPEKGRDVLLKVLEENPTSGNAWQQAAGFFRNHAQFADQAEEAFRKARELGLDIGTQLANLYQNNGELDKAEEEFKKARELGTNIGMQLAHFYRNRGEFDNAEKELLKARELGYNIGAELAQFYQNRGELDKAEEEFKKARELGYNIGTQLANLYQNNGELDKAIEEWREYFKKNISEYEVRNFLQNIANEHGPEAAAKEAEAIIAAQKEPDRRKNAMRGYFRFAREEYWSEKVLTISKQLQEAWPEDYQVLRDLMDGHRSYYSPYDPFPGIREFLAAPPKDHADLMKKLRVTSDLASHGYKQEAAEALAKLARHGLEMDANQEADYLQRLANAQQSIEPAKALATWRRILELGPPAFNPSHMRQARYNIFNAAINDGDTEAAVKEFVENIKNDRESHNLDSMWQTLTNALYKEKKYDELVALNTEMQALMPVQAYFHRLQIASARAAQEKTQEA